MRSWAPLAEEKRKREERFRHRKRRENIIGGFFFHGMEIKSEKKNMRDDQMSGKLPAQLSVEGRRNLMILKSI